MQTFLSAAHNPEYLTPELAYDNAGVCLRSAHHDVEAAQMFVDALTIRPTSRRRCGSSPTSISPQGKLADARQEIDSFLAANQETPDLLLLAVKVTRAQRDALDAELYARRLQLDFPNSAEARELADLGHNPG